MEYKTSITSENTDFVSSPETELLAALLQKSCFSVADGRINARDFKDPRHGIIFSMIEDIEHSGQLSDIVTVIKRLKAQNRLSAAGDRQYILQIAKSRRKMSAESAVRAIIAARKGRRAI